MSMFLFKLLWPLGPPDDPQQGAREVRVILDPDEAAHAFNTLHVWERVFKEFFVQLSKILCVIRCRPSS